MVILIFRLIPVQKQNVPKGGNRIYFGNASPESAQKNTQKTKNTTFSILVY